MSLTISVTESYVTSDEADEYLENNASWNTASDASKDDALLWARYYIDSKYSCISYLDEIPEELKYANSIIAADYLSTPEAFKPQRSLIKKAIQAGSVKMFKEFSATDKIRIPSEFKVKAILNGICPSKFNGTYVR